MKSILNSIKDIASELLLLFLTLVIVIVSVLSITSLWGLTFYETLEDDYAFVRLNTENSYIEMLREEDDETQINISGVIEEIE